MKIVVIQTTSYTKYIVKFHCFFYIFFMIVERAKRDMSDPEMNGVVGI